MRHLALIAMLLAAGSVIAAECTTLYKGKTLANWARRGDLTAVKALIDGGCGINSSSISPQVSNTNTDTPLTSAVKSKRSDALTVIKWLIDRGVDIDLRDSSNQTPLMVAASHNNVGAATILIRAGASLTATDQYHKKSTAGGATTIVNTGRTALSFSRSVKMFELLISYGVPLDHVPSNGITPLHKAAEHLRDGYIIDLMVAKHGSTSIITDANFMNSLTPLMLATYRDSPSMVLRRLIENGAKLEVTAPGSYKTALHHAAEYGHIANVRQLIKAGANVNAGRETKRGMSPIFAAINGAKTMARTEVVKVLIAAGGKVTDAAGNKPSVPDSHHGAAALKAIIDNPKLYWPIRAYALGIRYNPPIKWNSYTTSWLHISCHEASDSCLIYADCTDDSGAKPGHAILSAGASVDYSNAVPRSDTTTISSQLLYLGSSENGWQGRLDCALRSQQNITAQVWSKKDSTLANNTNYIRSDENNEAILQRTHPRNSYYRMDLRIRCIDDIGCNNTKLKCRKHDGTTTSKMSSINVGKIDRLKTKTLYNYARGEAASDIPGQVASCTVKSEGAFLVQVWSDTSIESYNHTWVSME